MFAGEEDNFGSVHADRSIMRWDVEGRPEQMLQLDALPTHVCSDPRDEHLVVVDAQGQVAVWPSSFRRLTPPRPLTRVTGGVAACAIDAQGYVLVVAADGSLSVWGAHESGRPLALGHTQARSTVECDVLVSPAGPIILIGSGDGVLAVWGPGKIGGPEEQTSAAPAEPVALVERQRISAHVAAVTGCRLDRGGARAITCSVDRTVKLWDVNGGRCLETFYADAPLVSMSVAGDAPIVAIAEQTTRVILLRISEDTAPNVSATPEIRPARA